LNRNLATTNRLCISCADHRNDLQRSLKVIENRYSAYNFLLQFHGNYGPILYHFPNIGRQSQNLYNPPLFNTFDPVEMSQRCLVLRKLVWRGYHMLKKVWLYVQPFWY